MRKIKALASVFGMAGSVLAGGVFSATPVLADAPVIPLSGVTLSFYLPFEEYPFTYEDVEATPFVYTDIHPLLGDFDLDGLPDCLQGRLSAVSKTSGANAEADSPGSDWIDQFIVDETNPHPGSESFASYTIDFLFDSECDNIGSVPATVTNLCINVKDIDEGQFAQFQNPSRYKLLVDSALTISMESGGNVRATDVEVIEENTDGDNEGFWYQVAYDQTSSVTFGTGISVHATEDYYAAIFDVVFGCSTWSGVTVEREPSAEGSRPHFDLDGLRSLLEGNESDLPKTK